MTTDDRLLSGASSEPSLHPNKSSGDIVELKPCPFCGTGNSIVECYQDDYGGWKVGCGRCGSHSGFRPKSDPDARAKVIANWNKRPAESAVAAAWDTTRSIIEPWTNASTMRQRAGEMTAQEVRTVQAILSAILDTIRASAIRAASGGKDG